MTFISPFVNPFLSPFEDTFSSLLYQLRFSYDKLGRTAGNTTHSNTRTAIATVVDFEGVLKTAKAGETRVEGARRVENLATALTTHSVTVEVDRVYQISCTGDDLSTVVLSGAATGTLTNDGSIQQGFDTPKTATTTTLTLTITGTLTGLLVEDVTGQAVTAPSDIIAHDTDHGWGANGVAYYDYENGNTISSGDVTRAKGSDISGISVLCEQAATNGVENSALVNTTGVEFDDWTRGEAGTSTVTIETSEVPPGAHIAAALYVDGSGNTASLSQTGTNRVSVGAGGVGTVTAWIKAASATGLKFSIRADDGAGGSLQYLNSDGSAWQDAATTFNPTDLPTDWSRWEHILPPTNTGRTHIFFKTANRNSGTDVTHYIARVQIEDNKDATSFIETGPSAVTRDKDAITFDSASNWFPSAEGFSLIKVTPQLDWATIGEITRWLRVNLTGGLIAYRGAANDGVRADDGTNTTHIYSGHTPGTAVLIATIWSTTLNTLQIGYYKYQEGTWHWDATPAVAYTEFVPTSLYLLERINDVETVAGIKIYSGIPESTLAATQTWLENNAANLIS